MKKLLLLSLLISAAFMTHAQTSTATYKAFKVDLDLGYAIPSVSTGSGTKAGATFTIEPHYRLSDALAIGFRFEGAALGYEQNNGTTNKVKVSLLTSYCPSLEYYLSNGEFRPFVGAGAGIFSQQSVTATGGNATLVPGASSFGVFPRVGFEAGHFRMSASYDIVGNNSSYLAFTIGFFLGGGKK